MAEKIVEKPINDIIRKSFLDYSREVIENRALPDVRDGLKPVQRRILYSMYELNITSDKPHRKSARVVGDVLGKYHPHGDAAVYDALVKMAQNFNKRYILVEGHGNFGTIDDSAAAMRYTEARLAAAAEYMLKDIDKDTVEWQENFDDTLMEPVVLPSMFPNLIVNGAAGIAVGISTNIPPHNLCETVEAIKAYIKKPSITVEELMEYIPGPDFPTGGIVDPDGLLECYKTGTGRIKVRAKAAIEELPDNKRLLVIKELPYQTSRVALLEKMAEYIEKRKENDVEEIRDESDKSGLRIVIEMKRGGNAGKLLKELYEKTGLETSFTFNLVALINGKPVTMSLKTMIEEYVKHRKEIVTRRTEYDLKKAEERKHILDGLILAVGNIDEVISIIKKSKNGKEAKGKLIKRFGFSDVQAQAVLEIRLQKLTALEIKTLKGELKNIIKTIKKYQTILSSEKGILNEIVKELDVIKEIFGDERRTLIQKFEDIEVKVKIEQFTVQANGKNIKKLSASYKGDKGICLKTDTTKNIYVFTEAGTYEKYSAAALPGQTKEPIVAMCNEDDYGENDDVIIATSDGMIKKSAFGEYTKGTGKAIKLNEGAKVAGILLGQHEDLVLATKNGYMIRFGHGDIRQIGRIAMGVKAVRLEDKDEVIALFSVKNGLNEGTIEVVIGSEKREIDLSRLKVQNRGGRGVKLIK